MHTFVAVTHGAREEFSVYKEQQLVEKLTALAAAYPDCTTDLFWIIRVHDEHGEREHLRHLDAVPPRTDPAAARTIAANIWVDVSEIA